MKMGAQQEGGASKQRREASEETNPAKHLEPGLLASRAVVK